MLGKGNPETDVWTYGGVFPGPLLRVRQGEPFRVVVENRLDEDTTVHGMASAFRTQWTACPA